MRWERDFPSALSVVIDIVLFGVEWLCLVSTWYVHGGCFVVFVGGVGPGVIWW